MIIGTGIDIIDIRRIDEAINKYGERFKKRCFLNSEITKMRFLTEKIKKIITILLNSKKVTLGE